MTTSEAVRKPPASRVSSKREYRVIRASTCWAVSPSLGSRPAWRFSRHFATSSWRFVVSVMITPMRRLSV